jgi:hypothetical protein
MQRRNMKDEEFFDRELCREKNYVFFWGSEKMPMWVSYLTIRFNEIIIWPVTGNAPTLCWSFTQTMFYLHPTQGFGAASPLLRQKL